MKKIKIFLLLCLLVCFGFALSPEVHAQGGGPKVFEVDEVLPPTTQLRISWVGNILNLGTSRYIETASSDYIVSRGPTGSISIGDIYIYSGSNNTFYNPYTNYDGDHAYIDIDISTWNENKRTINSVGSGMDIFRWEVLVPVPSGYSITFDENGGTSVTDLTEQTVLPNPLPIPTKSGYTFVNWYYDSAFTQIANPGDTIESNVTLYAKWQLNTYSITFEENGGTSVTDLTEQTVLPNPLPTPTIENNTYFLGWYYDSDFTNRAYPGDPLSSDITLYAKWSLTIGPKSFEVGDVLPAGDIKISWDFTGYPVASDDIFWIEGTNDFFIGIEEYGSITLVIMVDYFSGDTPGETIITLSNPCTITSLGSDSKDYYTYIFGALDWEVVSSEDPSEDPSIIYDDLYNLYNGEELDIELGYTLPAAKIAINLVYNNTGGQDDGMIVYTFGTYGRIALTAFEDMSPYVSETQAIINVIVLDDNWNMNILHDTLAEQTFGSTRGILSAGMIIDLTDASEEERTITGISYSNISDSRIEIDCVFSRILSIDESIYQDGYSEGYSEAMEIYGYYDDDTDQWLSVDEYLELYGEKMSSSNFYANFDKYFIPAMIIVFAGAIVLTILKVFKGRE